MTKKRKAIKPISKNITWTDASRTPIEIGIALSPEQIKAIQMGACVVLAWNDLPVVVSLKREADVVPIANDSLKARNAFGFGSIDPSTDYPRRIIKP